MLDTFRLQKQRYGSVLAFILDYTGGNCMIRKDDMKILAFFHVNNY